MALLEHLKNVHSNCVDLSKKIKCNNKNAREINIIGLYGSIIELIGNLIVLADKKLWIGLPSLIKTILEAHIELKNLYLNENYEQFMLAAHYTQNLKILKGVKEYTNPFFEDVRNPKNIDELILQYEIWLARLKKMGFNALSIRERFKKANELDVYHLIYERLSLDAHNYISDQIGRHFEIVENELKIIYYKDRQENAILSYIDTIAEILLAASNYMHISLRTRQENKMCQVR